MAYSGDAVQADQRLVECNRVSVWQYDAFAISIHWRAPKVRFRRRMCALLYERHSLGAPFLS